MGFEFNQAFILPEEHRPQSSISEAAGIPIIDLSPLFSSGTASQEPLILELQSACKEWGFFHAINHGVPAELLDRIQAAARGFFALPLHEKLRVRRGDENPLGYFEAENTRNVRDWKEVFDFVPGEEGRVEMPATEVAGETDTDWFSNQWPEYPTEFRDVFQEYGRQMQKLAWRLLELLSLSLGLPAKHLKCFFEGGDLSYIRLNYYPRCPEPQLALGLGRHKDSGAVTVLYQDEVSGLDIRRKSDGEWMRVNPIPNSFIINIGRSLNSSRYGVTTHTRVWSTGVSVNSERERLSIPFFLSPAHHVNVKPLEELTSEENPARYTEYNWGKFFKSRKNSNFKNLNKENVQISQFKQVSHVD